MQTPQPFWAIYSIVWLQLQLKNCSLLFKWNFLYTDLCPLPIVLPLDTTEKTSGCLLYHLLTLNDTHADKISLTHLKTKWPQPFQPLILDRHPNSLIIFLAISWPCSNMSLSLLYWEAQNRMQFFRCALITAELTGNNHLPQSAVDTPFVWGFFATLLAHAQLANRDTQVLLCKAVFQPFGPRLYWCMGLSFPACRTLHFLLLRPVCFSSLPNVLLAQPSGHQPVCSILYCLQTSQGHTLPHHPGQDVTQYWPQYWLLVPT